MTTYSELVTQIREYTETDSNVLTDTIVNDMIEHAEMRLYRELDLDVYKKNATASLTSGTPFVTLPGSIPTNFSAIRFVTIYSPSGSLGGLTDSERRILKKKDVSYLSEYWPNRTTTGIPKYYANYDEDSILIAPTPNAAYTIDLEYSALPTGLSSSNTTTWISNNAPTALLYACLVEAFKFLKGPPDMLATYEAAYANAVKTLATEQMGQKRREDYRDGVIRIPIPSENP
tara:strand:+ start:882 stop:1574 length:693 start_codon:yes stop_codon:yes gene_type:complete